MDASQLLQQLKTRLDKLVEEAPCDPSVFSYQFAPIRVLDQKLTSLRGVSLAPYIDQQLSSFVTHPYWKLMEISCVCYCPQDFHPSTTHLYCLFDCLEEKKSKWLKKTLAKLPLLEYLFTPTLPVGLSCSTIKTLHVNRANAFDSQLFPNLSHFIFQSVSALYVSSVSPLIATTITSSGDLITKPLAHIDPSLLKSHALGSHPLIAPPINNLTYRNQT